MLHFFLSIRAAFNTMGIIPNSNSEKVVIVLLQNKKINLIILQLVGVPSTLLNLMELNGLQGVVHVFIENLINRWRFGTMVFSNVIEFWPTQRIVRKKIENDLVKSTEPSTKSITDKRSVFSQNICFTKH